MADSKPRLSKEEMEWKLLKGAYLSKKQGETIERISKPTTREEIESLGDMGPISTACLSLYQVVDRQLNELTGCVSDTLTQFAFSLYRGSAQRNFKRGELLLTSIGQIGQYMPIDQQRGRIPPENVDFNKRSD